MRLALVILIILFVVLGAIFGALNSERIVLDLYFWQPSVPKGALILTAVVIGWLAGGIVAWLAPRPRIHRELRETRRRLREVQSEPKPPRDGTPDDA
jgi:uncharacterized integral membrane protein